MTTSTSKTTNQTIEIHEAYDGFTLANCDWMPEAREGKALDAMLNDIEKNGLIRPLEVDENNMIWCGRVRFLACQKLCKPFKVVRIESTEGESAARRDAKDRLLTVCDRLRAIGAAIRAIESTGDKCSRQNLAEYMRREHGWEYGCSAKQVEHLRKLTEAMTGFDEQQMNILRNAKSVHAARKALKLIKDPKKRRFTIQQVREGIEQILDQANKGELQTAELIENLKVLLKQIPAKKSKPSPTMPTKAKSKKAKTTKQTAA